MKPDYLASRASTPGVGRADRHWPLPVLVLFLAFQQWFVRSAAATGIKG